MKKAESFDALKQYIPEDCFEMVMPIIMQHKVHLSITKERATKLGDYRNKYLDKNHRISINGNLNKYSFIITLVHELAHLIAFEQYGNRIMPHGNQWKLCYKTLMTPYLQKQVFPADIHNELLRSMQNPAASTCSEEHLTRVLNHYDVKPVGIKTVEELLPGQKFIIKNGRTFIREHVIRKRIKCLEFPSMRPYLFSPLCQVKEINS